MADLLEATRVEAVGPTGSGAPDAPGEGCYRATLDPDWEVWGPWGGYLAFLALRALAAETELPRPASFGIHFLRVARFEPIEIRVRRTRRGRSAEPVQALATQDGKPVFEAWGWFVAEGIPGFEHEETGRPEVPGPDALKRFVELADDYEGWYPVWRRIDGKPVVWKRWEDLQAEQARGFEPGEPRWHTWMRLRDTPPFEDPVLEAGRSLLWLDLMMWNAIFPAHPVPLEWVAPNLDLSASFHQFHPKEEWLLCDAHAPVAGDGVVGCNGRVWTESGRLVASGTSTLLCRPAPAEGA